MNQYDLNCSRSQSQVLVSQNTLIRQVYAWMGAGLALTSLLALITISSPALLNAVVGNRLVFYGLVLGELGLVFVLSGAIARLSATAATLLFLGYSASTASPSRSSFWSTPPTPSPPPS